MTFRSAPGRRHIALRHPYIGGASVVRIDVPDRNFDTWNAGARRIENLTCNLSAVCSGLRKQRERQTYKSDLQDGPA